MKLAISIPDHLSVEADRAARELGVSRSALYGRALAEYLRSIASDRTTERLDEVIDRVQSPRSDFVGQAARRRLAQTEW